MSGHPRDSFDAALIPGMRDRLAEAYARFRAIEAQAVASMAPTGGSAAYRHRDCPGCGMASAGIAPVIQAHGLDLLDCPGCGLTYTRQVMDEVADAARYAASEVDREAMRLRSSGPYLALETARDRYYLDRLARSGATGGTLLEVGAGTGTLVLEAARTGFDAVGVEPGLAASAVARERGARVITGWCPADLPADPESYDAIAILDVLEHFADPVGFLVQLRDRLRPGGRLLVQVPNWDSPLVRLEGARSTVVCPGHWTYFTPASLPALCARAGFATLGVETVVSEIDRIGAFPADRVADVVAALRPGASWPMTPDALHALGLGYKLLGVFAAD